MENPFDTSHFSTKKSRYEILQKTQDLVLQCLRRHGEMSHAKISRITGLSEQTASVLMAKLLKDYLVVETYKRYGSISKPATQHQLNPHVFTL
jgi:predicted ArsR family transcriptional regulator